MSDTEGPGGSAETGGSWSSPVDTGASGGARASLDAAFIEPGEGSTTRTDTPLDPGGDRASLDAAFTEPGESSTTRTDTPLDPRGDRASLDAAFTEPDDTKDILQLFQGEVVELQTDAYPSPEIAAARQSMADAQPLNAEQQQKVMEAQVEAFNADPVPTVAARAGMGEQLEVFEVGDAPGRSDGSVRGDAQDRLHDLQDRGFALGGDPIGRAALWHEQGENDQGYEGTCGLVSVEGVARDAGVSTDENAVVELAKDNNLCVTDAVDPMDNGGTSVDQRSELLDRLGVDNHVLSVGSNDDLAALVENGDGVIARVSGGHLWDSESGNDAYSYEFDENDVPTGRYYANHAVQVTGTVRDDVGHLRGFVINDSGTDDGAGVVVDAAHWDAAWDGTIGPNIVNDSPPHDRRQV